MPAPALYCQSVESELWGNCGLLYRSVPFCRNMGTCPPPMPHAASSSWVSTDLGCSNCAKKTPQQLDFIYCCKPRLALHSYNRYYYYLQRPRLDNKIEQVWLKVWLFIHDLSITSRPCCTVQDSMLNHTPSPLSPVYRLTGLGQVQRKKDFSADSRQAVTLR